MIRPQNVPSWVQPGVRLSRAEVEALYPGLTIRGLSDLAPDCVIVVDYLGRLRVVVDVESQADGTR